jgi:hypothetical protein
VVGRHTKVVIHSLSLPYATAMSQGSNNKVIVMFSPTGTK